MKTRTSTAGRALVADEELAQLKRQLEQWRAGRRLGQRIPVQLWQDAVRAAVEHGAYRVGRELNLDYAVLKRRASAAAGNDTTSRSMI